MSKEENPPEMPTIGTGPGQIPADGLPPTGRSTLRIVRQGIFGTAKKTLSFLDQAEKDKTVKVRVDDQRSAALLVLGTVLLLSVGLGYYFFPSSKSLCIGLSVIADLILGASLVWFIVLRFGVLRNLDPRYAILCFQLLIGTGIFFTYLSINAAIIFLALLSK
ncbi:MAG: hypothetical protein K2X27_10650 [Candidatus Obscuribacterales bacterium]|nr:hypothetical protein [Candidatus Obscuribacterales bacterium]